MAAETESVAQRPTLCPVMNAEQHAIDVAWWKRRPENVEGCHALSSVIQEVLVIGEASAADDFDDGGVTTLIDDRKVDPFRDPPLSPERVNHDRCINLMERHGLAIGAVLWEDALARTQVLVVGAVESH